MFAALVGAHVELGAGADERIPDASVPGHPARGHAPPSRHADGGRWAGPQQPGGHPAWRPGTGLPSGEHVPAILAARVRPPGSPHIHLIAGGRPFFPAAVDAPDRRSAAAPVALLFPPGSTGATVPAAALGARLADFPYWLRCAGTHDPLWAAGAATGDPGGGPGGAGGGRGAGDPGGLRGSFDDYTAHLDGPFAWVVLARPVGDAEIARDRAALARVIPALHRRENDQDAQVELERATARHRELTRFATAGMWDVEVLVGGMTPARVAGLAAVLCGSSDLERLPYTLAPVSPTLRFDDLGSSPAPFRANAELLIALTRPPDRELPGITLTTPHTFDVSPEGPHRAGPAAPGGRSGSVPLGQVLDAGWAPVGVLSVPRDTLNRHAFVCGATGSGKSQTVRSLLESLSRDADPVPWLVLEPAKAEYARMAGRLDGVADVLVIRPGALDAPPASLNPLEPEPGFPVQSHLDLVRALFLAAFEAHEPFPQVLARALTLCYREAGWNLVLDRPEPEHRPRLRVAGPAADPLVPVRRRYPTLGDLQRTAGRMVEAIGYGHEVTSDVQGFVDVRIGSLREGTPGRFFEGGHPLDIGALLDRRVVLELEDITNDQDKAFLLGAVLIRVVEHLRVRYGSAGAGGLRHVLVVEEAHRLLRGNVEGPAAAAVELFASLLAEIRAYGEGVVVVEQIPAKILPDVVKNTALKVMHRLPATDDRDAVGGTMNLSDEQSEQVVAFPPGVAAVTVDGMDRPVLVRMAAGDHRESPDRARDDLVPLAGRRSLLCGPACAQARPCTLRETEVAAGHGNQPLLVVWMEALAAHQVMGLRQLTGAPEPGPGAALRALLSGLDTRTRDCVLAHAVDRTIGARRRLLSGCVDPDDTSARLAATARRLLADGDRTEGAHDANGFEGLPDDGTAGAGGTAGPGGTTGSRAAGTEEDEVRRWTAGMYRWQDVRRALAEAAQLPDLPPGPHPLTEDWRHRGLQVRGRTVRDQLDWLRRSAVYGPGQDAVSVGDARASGLADAVRALTGGLDGECVLEALRQACDGPGLADLAGQIADLVLTSATGAGGGGGGTSIGLTDPG